MHPSQLLPSPGEETWIEMAGWHTRHTSEALQLQADNLSRHFLLAALGVLSSPPSCPLEIGANVKETPASVPHWRGIFVESSSHWRLDAGFLIITIFFKHASPADQLFWRMRPLSREEAQGKECIDERLGQ